MLSFFFLHFFLTVLNLQCCRRLRIFIPFILCNRILGLQRNQAQSLLQEFVFILFFFLFLFPIGIFSIRLYFIVHDILMDVKKQLFPCKFCFKNLLYYLPVVPGEVGNLLTVSSQSKVLRWPLWLVKWGFEGNYYRTEEKLPRQDLNGGF